MSSAHIDDFSLGRTLLIIVTVAVALVTVDGLEVPQVNPGSFQCSFHCSSIACGPDLEFYEFFSQPPPNCTASRTLKILYEGFDVLVTNALANLMLIFDFLLL